jgi:transcriptional regulator with XRE-family HTH domain
MHALHQHRTRNGITLSWLARELGISRSTLWRYERGQWEPPKSLLFHAAHLLHVSPDKLSNAND